MMIKSREYILAAAILIATAVFLSMSAAADRDKLRPQITLPAKVERVVDGDTLDAIVAIRVRVRLVECWSPESNTPEGKAATLHLEELAEGKWGTLQVPIKDGNALRDLFSFGRLLGRVEIDGQDLADAQIEAGHATKEKLQ